MHRTEADGNVANAYVDQSLPGTLGTVVAASDRNAVQNELANAIERGGLTLKTAATETGDQLETLLFDTALTRTQEIKIDPAAAGDVGMLDFDRVEVYDGSNTDDSGKLTRRKLTFSEGVIITPSAEYGRDAAYINAAGSEGVTANHLATTLAPGFGYYRKTGSTANETRRLKTAATQIDFYRGDTGTASRFELDFDCTGKGAFTSLGGSLWTKTITTTIPWPVKIIRADVTWIDTDKRGAPCSFSAYESSGSLALRLDCVSAYEPWKSGSTSLKLHLVYDPT